MGYFLCKTMQAYGSVTGYSLLPLSLGDYSEDSLGNVLNSSVLDMQGELVRLFVSNRQDACLSGYSGSLKKERNKYKPSNVVNNV
jgi:hypothetical protein